MSTRGRVWFLLLNGWLIGFCLFYLLSALVLPRPAYFPLERRWALPGQSAGLAMLYYGQLLWGLLGGVAGGGAGALLGRFVPLSREACLIVIGWMISLILFTIFFTGVQVFSA